MRILVADDEQAIRQSIRRLLERAGHVVTECADGSQALRQLEQELPDVLLTDLRMPQLDGIELTRKLRTMPVRPRIIAMTGGPEVLLEMVVTLGADVTLSKPFTNEQLLDAVARVTA